MTDSPDPIRPSSTNGTGSGHASDGSPASGQSGGGTREPGLLRGRALLALAAVGIGVVAAVVIVSLTTDTTDSEPGDAAVIASEDTAVPAGSETPEGSTAPDERAVDLGAAASVGDFDVVLHTDPDGVVGVQLDDPATPALSDQPSKHCVLVELSGPASVEAFGCAEVSDDMTESVLTLSDPSDAAVGCAAVATKDATDSAGEVAATSGFLVTESTPLPAGSYQLSVTAVTGSGDGCAPSDGPTEHVTTTTADLQLG